MIYKHEQHAIFIWFTTYKASRSKSDEEEKKIEETFVEWVQMRLTLITGHVSNNQAYHATILGNDRDLVRFNQDVRRIRSLISVEISTLMWYNTDLHNV